MKKIIVLICVLSVIAACSSKEKKQPVVEKKVVEKRNINDYLIFENELTSNNIKDAEYKNITFQKEGAVFTRDSKNPTYIKIPFTSLDFTKGFNINFTFKTTFEDGRKPQSFLAFVNKFSSGSRVPLFIYLPGNRISGVYGKQLLWADGYKKENGNSRMYFDSYKIQKDKPYFVSINFDGSTMDFYVNSELYATFDNLQSNELKSKFLTIGALVKDEKAGTPFEGTIYGLSIYNQPLKEKEIISIFNSQPSFFEY